MRGEILSVAPSVNEGCFGCLSEGVFSKMDLTAVKGVYATLVNFYLTDSCFGTGRLIAGLDRCVSSTKISMTLWLRIHRRLVLAQAATGRPRGRCPLSCLS